MKALRTPEKVVQAQIVKLLKQVGARVYVLGTRRAKGDHQGTRQTPGVPDVIAFVPRKYGPPGDPQDEWTHLYIEVKADGGRMRAEQLEFARYCGLAHVRHIVGGLDPVIAVLVEHGRLKE